MNTKYLCMIFFSFFCIEKNYNATMTDSGKANQQEEVCFHLFFSVFILQQIINDHRFIIDRSKQGSWNGSRDRYLLLFFFFFLIVFQFLTFPTLSLSLSLFFSLNVNVHLLIYRFFLGRRRKREKKGQKGGQKGSQERRRYHFSHRKKRKRKRKEKKVVIHTNLE